MDNILEGINPFGVFQKCILVLIGSTSILSALTVYSIVFISAEPKLICFRQFKNETVNYYDEDACRIWSNLTRQVLARSNPEYSCKFDDKYYGLTMINEWNLVCDKRYLASLLQTCYFLGTLLCIFVGYFSDKFGRKTVAIILVSLMTLMLILVEVVQLNIFNLDLNTKLFIYSGIQLVLGACSNSLYSVAFVLLLEITTPAYNTIVSNVNLYMFVVGELVVLVVAYFTKNWHLLNLINALYSVILLICLCLFLPESPRYLVEAKKYEQAYKVLRKIAKINKSKKTMTENENLQSLLNENSGEIAVKKFENLIFKNQNIEDKLDNTDNGVISYLFNKKSNIFKTFLLTYVWLSLNLVYYGVSLGITTVGETNPYFMYFLSSVAEFIGYASCHLNDKFGRKKMFIIYLGLAGIMCFTVALIPHGKNLGETLAWNSILIIIFASIGKASTSAAYNSTYIFTSLLYPTAVRSTLLLLISGLSRIGSLASPQINLLGSFFKPLPYFVFGASSILACISIFILPNPE